MIRRTIARAFGRTLTENVAQPVPPEAQEALRARRAQAAFAELYECFQNNIERRILAGCGEPRLRFSPIGQGLEGQQFVVEAPGIVCRVRNSMNGLLWMATQQEGDAERHQILSLHRDETERYQLISKELGKEVGARTSFQFTSVPSLVEGVIGPAPDEREIATTTEAPQESDRGEQ